MISDKKIQFIGYFSSNTGTGPTCANNKQENLIYTRTSNQVCPIYLHRITHLKQLMERH